MWTLFIKLSTMIVEQIFVRIPGVAYDPPAGCVMVDVPRSTYVGKGFTASQDGTGAWTFAPPVVPEEPPAERTLNERLELAEAKMAEAVAELQLIKADIG